MQTFEGAKVFADSRRKYLQTLAVITLQNIWNDYYSNIVIVLPVAIGSLCSAVLVNPYISRTFLIKRNLSKRNTAYQYLSKQVAHKVDYVRYWKQLPIEGKILIRKIKHRTNLVNGSLFFKERLS